MNLRSPRYVILVLATVLGSSATAPAGGPDASATPAKVPSSAGFEREVVPFLAKHCYSCHGGGKNKGDALRKDDDRFATLIVGVVKSGPFQMRTTRGEEP